MKLFQKLFKKTKIHKNPIEYAKSLGVKLGKNVKIITMYEFPYLWPNFGSEPYLIEIGDNAKISFDVTFLTHDGGHHACQDLINKDTKIITLGKIKIGKNCFIGCKSIIMPNVTIGDRSIIGAGSIVTKNVPPGEVWAGNPAHFIKKTEDYAQKLQNQSITEEKITLYNIVMSKRQQINK